MPTPIKYPQLTKEYVLENLKRMSVAQMAKQEGCPPSSIRWVLQRYCTDQEVAGIVVERKHSKR
jgi:hypothetical protein